MGAKADVTIEYYNQNAARFLEDTAGVEFTEIQNAFLSLLPEGARILDFGCGSGRDALEFLKRGYQVEATDGSEEMCRAAAELTGLAVRQMLFQELDEKEGLFVHPAFVQTRAWGCAGKDDSGAEDKWRHLYIV